MTNHTDPNTALNTEAREMALTIINGNRSDAREFIVGHETPAKLVLAILRHLGSEEFQGDMGVYLSAIVNLQSLLESVEV